MPAKRRPCICCPAVFAVTGREASLCPACLAYIREVIAMGPGDLPPEEIRPAVFAIEEWDEDA